MSRKWLLSTVTFVLTAGLLLLLYSAREVELKSRVWPRVLVAGEPLNYIDSTYAAATSGHSWRWEFGQGDSALAPQGVFYYPQPGTYRVRLTVDGQYQHLFTVVVKAPLPRNTTIRLLGPKEGYVGEKLLFQTFGAPAQKFSWKFGDNKKASSHEATTFYTYDKPGTYIVELATDVTKDPLRQKITILPKYSTFVQPADTMDDDIRARLQRIADGRQVNQQYTYLLNRYLCGKTDALVVAGEQPPSDFYSYCMNLQFDPDWVIDAAAVEVDSARNLKGRSTGGCTAKLVVTQHKKN
ncbi:MAG: PKD domain-containing protein [Janthinobacterium lividum]